MQPLSAAATHHTMAYLDVDNEKLGADHPGYCGSRVWTNCFFFLTRSKGVQVGWWVGGFS